MSDGYRRRIGRLAAPITLAMLVGVLVQFAVVALLGQLSDQALYVRSLYLPVAFLVLALQEGLNISTQVAVAISRGREDRAGMAAVAGSFVRLGLGLFSVACLGIASAAPVLATLLSAEDADRAVFVAFVRWTALAGVAAVGPIVLAAALRGWGKAAAAAAVSVSMAVAQVGLVALLGFGTGLGLFAVPVGTAGGAAVGLAVAVLGWRRHRLPAIDPKAWRPTTVRTLLGVGLPVATSYLLLFGANLGMLWVIGPFGPVVVSGFAAAYTVQTVLVVPAVAVGSAAAIVLNQLRGHGRQTALPAAFRAGVELVLLLYLALVTTAWFARHVLAAAVTASPAIAEEVLRYLGVVLPTVALLGVVLAVLTVLEQLGAGLVAVLLNGGYFAVILAIGGLVARHHGDPAPLYWTVAIANGLGAPLVLALASVLVRGQARNRRAEPLTPATTTEGST